MSPHALDKTGTRHTDTQWKAKGGEVREQKPLNAPHIKLLLPAPLINKPYGPEHEEFHACASIVIPLSNWLQMLLVVYLVKLCLTSFILGLHHSRVECRRHLNFFSSKIPTNHLFATSTLMWTSLRTSVVQKLKGTGLQAQAVFKEKLTFRPHSTASQTHRKMTLSIADRASKTQKIKMLPAAGMDPEAQRSELIKVNVQRDQCLDWSPENKGKENKLIYYLFSILKGLQSFKIIRNDHNSNSNNYYSYMNLLTSVFIFSLNRKKTKDSELNCGVKINNAECVREAMQRAWVLVFWSLTDMMTKERIWNRVYWP